MNYRIFLVFIIFLLFSNCDQNNFSGKKKNFVIEKRYKNTGFALIYDEKLKLKKKIDDNSLDIFHSSLKKSSQVKITNPDNGKSLIANVKSNKVHFSHFYNSIISPKIAKTLELDLKAPYIEIILISKNSTFVAKKTKTYKEEKKIADKAPIDGIQINDLNKKNDKKKDKKKINYLYSIKIADFYYKNSAILLLDRIKKNTSIKNTKIIKLSDKNYRVLIGPFNDIRIMQVTFDQMKKLNFENLQILRNAKKN